jgi:prolyl-tRNA editing enzyme YbaK/EbsC (Cys-tRNA(Pro) deacylase)
VSAVSGPVDRVVAALRAGGVDAEVRRFAEPVPTAAAAAEALGCEVGAIANSLVFDADGEPLLVLASGAHRVDTGKIAALVGADRVRRAGPEFVLAATGQEVGGVAPVGHPAPLRTVVDTDLAAHPVLWAGAGDHHTMFAATYQELVRVTAGEPAAVG